MNQQSSMLFFTLYLAFTPIIFWLWFSYYKREQEKFSPGFMALLVALGAFAVVPSGVLEYLVFTYVVPRDFSMCFFSDCQLTSQTIMRLFAISFGIVAIIEEGSKIALLYWFVRKSDKFSRLIDGIRYGALFGMGFAGLENGIYLFESFSQQDFNQLFVIFLLRFLISSVGHALYGAIMGFFLFKFKFATLFRKRYIALAIIAPWVLHGLFNFFLITKLGFYTVFLVAGALVLLVYELGDPRAKETIHVDASKKNVDVAPARQFAVNREKVKKVQTMLYTCPLCHNKNILEAKFCAQCGYSLE